MHEYHLNHFLQSLKHKLCSNMLIFPFSCVWQGMFYLIFFPSWTKLVQWRLYLDNCEKIGSKKLRYCWQIKFGQNGVSNKGDIADIEFVWWWLVGGLESIKEVLTKRKLLVHKNWGPQKLGPKSLFIIGSVRPEILLIWTNVTRTNVAWTNVTMTLDICLRTVPVSCL